MSGDCPKSDCIFKHDPSIKGRSDLIPTCNLIKQKGPCDRPACTFAHPKQSAKAARKLAAQLAQQAAVVANGSPLPAQTPAQTNEVSELKAMILDLVQQGAEHIKALIAGAPSQSVVPAKPLSSVVVVATPPL